jgi:hypothetical protein
LAETLPQIVFDGPLGSVTTGLATLIALALVASWVILAGSRFVQGGVVERPDRVPQLYGYTVCLIGLLMAVISALSMVESVVKLQAPAATSYEGRYFGMSVGSFETFRITYGAGAFPSYPGAPSPEPLSEDELRRRYNALRADRIFLVRVEARRALLLSALSFIVGVGLFVFHWRWLKRLPARINAA